MNVELDVASETGDGDMARSVEQCDCPAGHTGTSCEVGSFKDVQPWVRLVYKFIK